MEIKRFKDFLENAAASASSSAGMGAVANATVGGAPGTATLSGSGDVSFYMLDKKKRKKGNPSQVTDLRDLAPTREITKLTESVSRDPKLNGEIQQIIKNCTFEITDQDFDLELLIYDVDRHFLDGSNEKTGNDWIDYEELRISFYKPILANWTGNYHIRCNFDENGEKSRRISTLRARGSEMSREEQMLFDIVEDVAIKLIRNLDYQRGSFDISWRVAGSAMPWNTKREVDVNIHFVLLNDLEN